MSQSDTGIDRPRALIAAALDQRRMEMAELSKTIGRNHAYIFQYLKQGKPQKLPEDVRRAIAAALNLDEQQLRGLPANTPLTTPAMRPRSNVTILGNTAIRPEEWGTIPVYGQAMGGADGRFILNGNKIGDVLAPPSVAGVSGAYAVYVVGTSMEPRYFAGEAVYVHPRLPVRSGDFVVVQIRGEEGEPPSGYVKEFVSMDSRRLRLRQFNPPQDLEFPAAEVESVHKIVLAG